MLGACGCPDGLYLKKLLTGLKRNLVDLIVQGINRFYPNGKF